MSLEQGRLYNFLFLCLVVERYSTRFEENGALSLNHLIQERSGISKEEAFALISDTITEGYLGVERENGKKLVVNKIKYIELRDRLNEIVPKIQSQVVSEKWIFSSPLRKELTESENVSLDKNIKLGRLKEVRSEMYSPERSIVNHIEHQLRSSYSSNVSDPPEEMRENLIKVMQEPIGALTKLCNDHDFVFMVEKNGSKIIPKFKLIKRDGKLIDVDWSQV